MGGRGYTLRVQGSFPRIEKKTNIPLPACIPKTGMGAGGQFFGC